MDLHRIWQNLQFASNYLYAVVDWGMHYYQGLYGHKSQSVLYIEPLQSDQQIRSLKEQSQKYQRKLLFIYHHDRNPFRLGSAVRRINDITA